MNAYEHELERLLQRKVHEDLMLRVEEHSCPRCKILMLIDRYGEWCALCGYRPETSP